MRDIYAVCSLSMLSRPDHQTAVRISACVCVWKKTVFVGISEVCSKILDSKKETFREELKRRANEEKREIGWVTGAFMVCLPKQEAS